MKKSTAIVVAVVVGSIGLSADARAEDFHKLTGRQIRHKVIGMQFTDEVHWREVYWRDGTAKSAGMGRKLVGRWRIEKDRLCTDYGADDGNCYEVWVSGRKVQMRTPGAVDTVLEGVLQKAPKRR